MADLENMMQDISLAPPPRPEWRYTSQATPQNQRRPRTPRSAGKQASYMGPGQTEEVSTTGAVALSIFICFLFLAIIGIAAHYGTGGYYQRQMRPLDSYTGDKWWCYHCSGLECASSCWS